MSHVRKVVLVLLGLGAVLTLGLVSSCAILSESRPMGREGPQAEAFADRMLESVQASSWSKTGAVRWRFPRGHDHLWDRTRQFARVRWDEHEVLINLATRAGVARTKGTKIEGEQARELLEKAWAMWANDSFWLNPIVKVRDPGTSRQLVTTDEGERALLVTYSSGGVTPGDAYLWTMDEQTGKPRGWKMWVSVIPVGGLEFEWEQWQQLSTGAWIAAGHDGIFNVQLEAIAGARSLAELEPGPDPFAELR